jgi:uncharacterized protein YbjT (DUF2867 family)
MKMKKIFITGATGSVGTQLVKKLAVLDIPFKALVRTSDSGDLLRNLSNAEIVVGDMAEENSLIDSLQGIDSTFLLTNSSEEAERLQLNFVNAAYKAGVKHIVKLSQFAADVHSPVRFLRYHATVENRIKELGFTYTFLRPNLYMQGLYAFRDHIKTDGRFYASIGNAAISAVDIRDIAAVAAIALTEEGHENKIYNITGPEALTHYQMAEVFSRILGKQISFIDVMPEKMEGALHAARFPEWQVGGLLEDYAHYARGEAATVYSTVNDVTNIPATSFEQFVDDYKMLFL